MASAESMSLEETNKIRIGLGLAPLAGEDGEDGGSVNLSDDPDALAEANWAEKRNAEKAARSEKEAKERLARAKNQRELRAKLHGKGLGEADDGGDDGAATATSAAAWVKQSRKRAKEREKELEKLRQRERELEERDREAIYDEQDLAGLKVAHGVDDFEQGADVILTLTDRKVLDDEGGCSACNCTTHPANSTALNRRRVTECQPRRVCSYSRAGGSQEEGQDSLPVHWLRRRRV